MTSPLFKHEVQFRCNDGSWCTSALNSCHDGTLEGADRERREAQWRNPENWYRMMTVLVPPAYKIQMQRRDGVWGSSAWNTRHDGSWLEAMRMFQALQRVQADSVDPIRYRVVQVDA